MDAFETEFYYNWAGKKTILVQVTAAGYNPEEMDLVYPRIRFFDAKDRTPWRMYYLKKEFDAIQRMGYYLIASKYDKTETK